ncbi:nucleotidyltransferase domain-containing protein [candidate division KSB1 bacterium]|nr:nucleotidyltransferase domain-containing protein [candidate division KSB1 bacterium]
MKAQIRNIVKEFVQEVQGILKTNLVEGYLFGSYTRNEQTPESDIDLLFIVRQFNAQIRNEISSLSSDYSLERDVIISPIIKDVQVWEKNRKFETLFYKEIMKDGIRLC